MHSFFFSILRAKWGSIEQNKTRRICGEMIVHLVPQSHDTGYGKRKEKEMMILIGFFLVNLRLGSFFFPRFFHLLCFLFFPCFSLVHLAGVSLSAHGCLFGNGRSLDREAWSQKVWL